MGLIGTNGAAGITSVTGLIGWVTSGELFERVCADGEDGRGGLWGVDGELGELGVDRKRTLQGVGMRIV